MKFLIPDEHKNASGVYIIRNTVNEKVYVGSTVNFRKRYLAHRRALEKSMHHSHSLSRFAAKHGLETLLFDLLEATLADKNILLSTEQKWIDLLLPFRNNGFNSSPTAGSIMGWRASDEQRRRRSENQKGRRHSDESKGRMSEAQKSLHKQLSQEAKQRLSDANKGKRHSEETKQKMSESQKKKAAILSNEARERIRSAARRPKSLESCQKASETRKKRWAEKGHPLAGRPRTEEVKKKVSEARKGRVVISPEHRARLAECCRTRIVSPETRAKMAASQKARQEANKKASPQ